MKVSVELSPLRDVLVVKNEVFSDHRGFFMEAFHQTEFEKLGLPSAFVQLNHSRSARGVLRGLHFQWEPPMSKLMRVIAGTAFLVAVDIRKGSPTLGKWFGMTVSADEHKQLWAPAGVARGFCVLSEFAEIQYFCTGTYNPACESGVAWNDPAIGIDWPLSDPILSNKDAGAQTLAQWLARPESNYFDYSGDRISSRPLRQAGSGVSI